MIKKIVILFIIISCGNTFCLYSQNKDLKEEQFSPPEKMPIKRDLCSFVLDRLVYPRSAINDTISGTVILEFYVEVNGKTTAHKVIKGVRADLNDEALRIARLLIFDEPAYTRSKAVGTTYILPIHFILDYDPLQLKYVPRLKCKDIYNTYDDSTELIFAMGNWPQFNKEGSEGLGKFIKENVREKKLKIVI